MGYSPIMKPSTIYANQLTFDEAMKAIINGERITKLEWHNPNQYGQMREGWLMIRRGGVWYQWLVNDGDLLGTDWMVVK